MARFRQDFSIYSRKISDTRRVWYYRTYTPEGVRTIGKSTGVEDTGANSRKRAEKYCTDLLRAGRLWSASSMKFALYAEPWFVPGRCTWLADRMASGVPGRPAISPKYLTQLQMMLRLYLVPYFGEKSLEDIKPSTVKSFRVWMQAKQLSNGTINQVADVLRIMTEWMLSDGIIQLDPFRSVKRFLEEKSNRRAFTLEEAQAVFSAPWSNRLSRLFNLTAAMTGLRLSEIRAIRRETLFNDHIDVRDQFTNTGLAALKTKEARKVPIPAELYALLAPEADARGWVFAMPGADRPMGRNTPVDPLVALIPKDSGLCFHSWRHFFNTWLISHNVAPAKVRAVMGHSEGKGAMTENYTSWAPEMFPEVYEAQRELFAKLKAESTSL